MPLVPIHQNSQAQELMSRCSGAGTCGTSNSLSFPVTVLSSTYISSYPLPIIPQMLMEGLLYARHFSRPFWEWPGLAFSTALQGSRKKMYILFNCPPASLSQCLTRSLASGQHSALVEQVDGGVHVSLSNCPLPTCGDSSLVTHTPTWWSLHTHSLC